MTPINKVRPTPEEYASHGMDQLAHTTNMQRNWT